MAEPDEPHLPAGRAGRRAARGSAPSTPSSGLPSVVELVVYGSLATVVAVAVLVVNGRPWWQCAALVAGAAALMGAVAVMASRTRPDEPSEAPRTGRRRRRRSP